MPSSATMRHSARCGRRSTFPPTEPGEIRVSLFCYPNPALPQLLDAWAEGDDAVVCVVPEGVATGALDAWTAGNVPHPGHPYHRGRLTLHAIPFVAQDDLRPAALELVAQFRARRGFVRSRAVGSAPVRLAHLSPAARGALAEARRVSRALDRRPRIAARRRRCAASREPGTARRMRWTRLGGTSCWRDRHSSGMPRSGRRDSPNCPTWRQDWSRPPCIGYN